ncbi:MAG TPA: ABC transporter substrate-binding protein [Candidatus Sulfotelmatobacter sp.]|nr:ABC transporter substrate-binding protein [Candidatus Sulfotelmatobacter sp.]
MRSGVMSCVVSVLVAVACGSAPLSTAHAQAKGAQITISQTADTETLDPGKTTLILNVNLMFNLYDTLTRWDAGLKLQPGLATAWKNVSDTVWEFTLRQGVKFHDGTPLTAEDVKATLDRLMTPGKTLYQTSFATVSAVEITSPQTIRVVTKNPDSLLPVRMAQMGSQIIPARFARSDAGGAELARKAVGTGAYKLAEWVKDEQMVMDANKEWWGWDGKPPAIERVIWKPIPDDFARVSALERGEVDIITNVPPDHVKGIRDGRDTRILTIPSTRTVIFSMNASQPPLSDKRVRQALHYAVDVPSIVKNLFAGQGKLMSGMLADTDFGYNPQLKPYPYDPAGAKRLLAEAGYGSGIDVTLYAGSGTMVNDKQLLEAIADMWSKVGVRAKVQMLEMAQRSKMNNERLVPPNSMLLTTPQSTLLDADGSVWRLLHPTGLWGKHWAGSQPGQRFYELMEQARVSLDQRKRKALYTEATQILHEEKPYLELFQEVLTYGTSKRVTFKPRPDYRLIVSEMTATP